MDNWYSLYQEMYYMAYDTTQFLNGNQVFNMVYPTFQSDTIPIGIIDWDFNLLKDDALNTNTYFIFDTVNDVLYDKPGAPSPFTIQTTFAGAALQQTFPFTNPVFEVNPQWMFKDSSKNYGTNELELKIDFGDGAGWQSFTDNQIQHYQAFYPSGGIKTLQYAIFYQGNLTRYSLSVIFITTDDDAIQPDSTIYLPGITLSYFGPTSGCNTNVEKKYVIYLEGFDLFNNRHASEIYSERIDKNEIAQLLNFGYTFVIVDWHDAHIPIQLNAMSVVNLLEFLKCNGVGSDIPPPPFVIFGESMGGLVGRYALTYMEQPNYVPSCGSGVAHNTRLFITVDTPHQGANIPLGYQYMYRYSSNGLLATMGFTPYLTSILEKLSQLLDGSATQMLKYHIDSDPAGLLTSSSSVITEHTNKTQFDAQLMALGNYPKFCKLVALSNGSWLGAHQRLAWDTTAYRTANDRFLDIQSEITIRILGFKILGTKFDLMIRSNPSGTGEVLKNSLGISHWKMDVFWFGVKPVWWTTYLRQISKSAESVKPYCTMPGSLTMKPGTGIGTDYSFSSFNLLDFFGFTTTAGSGTLNVQAQYGPSFFGDFYLDLTAYSDGLAFGFVPTASSLDYNNPGMPLDYPLLSDPIDLILSRTPFDAVYTNPTFQNRPHGFIRNPSLEICETCNNLPNADSVHSYLLNREIGDDTLWLENLNANFKKPIEAERDILVNHRNIYYNYDGDWGLYNFNLDQFPNNYSQTKPGAIVLSKQNSVNFIAPGKLRSNVHLHVNGAQPPTGSYSWQQNGMSICCIDYTNKTAPPVWVPATNSASGKLAVYPNPTNSQITIHYRMQTKDRVQITVTDMLGRRVAQWNPHFEDSTQECYYGVSPTDIAWPSGIYIISVSNGNETYRTQLLINR